MTQQLTEMTGKEVIRFLNGKLRYGRVSSEQVECYLVKHVRQRQIIDGRTAAIKNRQKNLKT